MEINVTELAPCRKKVSVAVPVERVREEFEKSYKELGGEAKVPGFRPGRVPRKVLQKRYAAKVGEQVKLALLQEVFKTMLEDLQLEPVADPDLDLKALTVSEDEAFSLELELEVKPEFDLGDYKGLEVRRVELALEPAEIDRTLELMRRQRAELVPIDGAEIHDGDHVICDFTLTCDGEQALHEENIPLRIRAGAKIPPFEIPYDDFIGKQVEQQLTGQTTLPKQFAREELRGKQAEYVLAIRAHQRPELPELDEEFCREFGCAGEAALRERVRHDLEHNLEHQAESLIEDRLLDLLLERTPFEVPESITKQERQRVLRIEELEMRRAGLPEEEIRETLTAAQGEREEEVLRKVRRALITDRIARLEGEALAVSDEEVEQRIKLLAQANGVWPNQMRKRLEESGAIDQLTDQIRTQKVRTFLREQATIIEPEQATKE